MDLYKQLDDLEAALCKATSSYSQSNPTQVMNIRDLRKNINKIQAQIKELEEKQILYKNIKVHKQT